jgi:small subunit ribosomal protein S14
MAKISAIQKNKRKKRTVKKYYKQRERLKEMVYDKSLPANERFEASLKLAALPRDGSKTRIRNRCGITGRPRGYHRKYNMSRIMLRELALDGMLPGVTKSSW